MAIKVYKPTTPSRRNMSGVDFGVLTRTKPLKSLTRGRKKQAGRSAASGKISVRHQGGGAKQNYRQIDFRQDKFEIPAKVASIEYDPNRTSFITLLHYQDGEKRYILAPAGIKVGQVVVSSKRKAPVEPGNRLPLKKLAVGTLIHNIELNPGQGGRLVRSAGAAATIMAREGGHVHLRMPSGEERMVSQEAMASVGQLSNIERAGIKLGKAGRRRWLGVRPAVRGSAMNPVDHPHGGGEGRSPVGRDNPKTPWGKPALGKKTRPKHKRSNRFIVRDRRRK